MRLFLLLITLSVTAQGCAPGTGALGARGTFQFDMIPPVLYTYSSTDLSHGQLSQSFANSVLASDVKNSVSYGDSESLESQNFRFRIR